MSHMQKDVCFGDWYRVSCNNGETSWVPADLCPPNRTALSQYVEGTIDDNEDAIEEVRGWGARMSAPGYLDCTSWCVFDTEQEALDHLEEFYGDGDEP